MPPGVTYQFSLTLDASTIRTQSQAVHDELLKQLSLPKEVSASYQTLIDTFNTLKTAAQAAGQAITQAVGQSTTAGLGSLSGVTPLGKSDLNAVRQQIQTVNASTKAIKANFDQQAELRRQERVALNETIRMSAERAKAQVQDTRNQALVLTTENALKRQELASVSLTQRQAKQDLGKGQYWVEEGQYWGFLESQELERQKQSWKAEQTQIEAQEARLAAAGKPTITQDELQQYLGAKEQAQKQELYQDKMFNEESKRTIAERFELQRQQAEAYQAQPFMKKFGLGVEKETREQWALRRVAYDLQYFGRQLTQVGAAGVASLGLLANAYLNFDEAATRAGMAMRINTELQDDLRTGILDTSKAIGMFDPSQIAEGLRLWAAGTGEVVQTEGQLNDMLATTTDIQKLAAMNNVEFAATTDNVGGIMHEFGLQTKDVNRIVSVLNYTASESFANVDDMGQAFRMVGPLAHDLGISLEETASVLGALADQNIKSTMAGRAFRQILLGILDPTKDYNDAMNEVLGVTGKQADAWRKIMMPEGKFVGIADYFEKLAEATKKMTSAQRAEFAAVVTTNNATPSFIALLEEQNKVQELGINILSVKSKLTQDVVDDEVLAYKRWYEATTKLPFSLEGAFARMNNMWREYEQSDAARMARLKQRYATTLITLGEAAEKALIPSLEKLAGHFQDIADTLESHPGWAKWILWSSAASIGLGQVVGQAGTLLRLFTDIMILSKGIREAGGWGALLATGGGAIATGLGVGALTIGAIAASSLLVDKNAPVREIPGLPTFRDPIIDRLAKESLETQNKFNEAFKRTQLGYGAVSKEAKKMWSEITQGAGGALTTIEQLEQVLNRIKGSAGEGTRLFFEARVQYQEALSPYAARVPTFEPLMPTLTPEVRTAEQEAQAEKFYDYQQNLADTAKDFADRRAKINADYNDWVLESDADLIAKLSDLWNNYERSKSEAIEDHAAKMARMARDNQEQEQKAAADHYDRLRKLELDHKDKMIDLLEERDVRGLVKEMRSYKRAKSEEERNYSRDAADRKSDNAQRMADAEADFQKEQERKRQEYEISRQDAIDALAKDRVARKAERDKALAELSPEAEAKALDEITKQFLISTFGLRAVLGWQYEQLLREEEAFLGKYNKIMEDNLLQAQDYLRFLATGGIPNIEDVQKLFEGTMPTEGMSIPLQSTLVTQKQVTEPIVAKAAQDTLTAWDRIQAFSEGIVGNVETVTVNLIQGTKDFIGGMNQSGALFWTEQLEMYSWYRQLRETLFPTTAQASAGEIGQRQSGGYANSGMYRLGETGREFVLSAPTTSILEQRWGGLTQEKLMRSGDNVSFSFSGMGREDREWYRRETMKIVDGRLSQIHKAVAGAR